VISDADGDILAEGSGDGWGLDSGDSAAAYDGVLEGEAMEPDSDDSDPTVW
jgi:hypothetical protein